MDEKSCIKSNYRNVNMRKVPSTIPKEQKAVVKYMVNICLMTESAVIAPLG